MYKRLALPPLVVCLCCILSVIIKKGLCIHAAPKTKVSFPQQAAGEVMQRVWISVGVYLTHQVVVVVAAAGGVLVEGGNRCDVAVHQAVKDLKPERKYSQTYNLLH